MNRHENLWRLECEEREERNRREDFERQSNRQFNGLFIPVIIVTAIVFWLMIILGK